MLSFIISSWGKEETLITAAQVHERVMGTETPQICTLWANG